MNWDPEKKFKVEEDNLLNLRTGYPLYLQTTHKRPFMLGQMLDNVMSLNSQPVTTCPIFVAIE